MKRSLLTISILIAGFIYFLSSCTADKLSLPEPSGLSCDQTTITYEGHVRGILNTQCNTSGCHDGNVMQPFEAYSSMDQTRRERIYTRACVTKDMPPAGGLNLGYIDTIRCWQESGYLEN
ncbi:MAG: hypothetical protein AB8E82_20550 [Aureispira sp.]